MPTPREYDKKICQAITVNSSEQLAAVLAEMKIRSLGVNAVMKKNYLELVCTANSSPQLYGQLLRAGISQIQGLIGRNPLLFAAADEQNYSLVHELIAGGASVNISGISELPSGLDGPAPDGTTNSPTAPIKMPLVCAALTQYKYCAPTQEFVMRLLEVPGLDCRREDEVGNNAFVYAAAYGSPAVAEKMLALDPHGFSHAQNKNLITGAVFNYNTSMADYLLNQRQGSPNEVSATGQKDSLEILLTLHNNWAAGVNDWISARATQDSARGQIEELYQLLIKHGAKLEARHKPYLAAAQRFRHSFITGNPREKAPGWLGSEKS